MVVSYGNVCGVVVPYGKKVIVVFCYNGGLCCVEGVATEGEKGPG